ncbi:MAG: hypothetical protein AAFQ22_01900 [Pseudomonadota bacterium]
MEALRDPFSRVHPFFWPVLWLSLRAFVRWTGRMMDEGHAFAGLRIELTWYGWIHVEAIDLSEAGADFRRHMIGDGRKEGWSLLADTAERVEALLAIGCIEGAARYAPSALTANTDGAYRFAPCILRPERNRSHVSTGPPLGLAPSSTIEGGAAPANCSAQSPPRAGARAGESARP